MKTRIPPNRWIVLLPLLWLVSLPASAQEPIWIDVRSQDEYAQQHVPDAVNLHYDEIAQGIAALDVALDTPLHLYCGSGRRAGIAKQTLESLGYTEVINIGGLEQALRTAQ